MRNKKQAIQTSLKVWRYLATHPEIFDKTLLPPSLFKLIKKDESNCPLCVLFYHDGCRGCPLDEAGDNCIKVDCSSFSVWYCSKWHSNGKEERARSARKIADELEAALLWT